MNRNFWPGQFPTAAGVLGAFAALGALGLWLRPGCSFAGAFAIAATSWTGVMIGIALVSWADTIGSDLKMPSWLNWTAGILLTLGWFWGMAAIPAAIAEHFRCF